MLSVNSSKASIVRQCRFLRVTHFLSKNCCGEVQLVDPRTCSAPFRQEKNKDEFHALVRRGIMVTVRMVKRWRIRKSSFTSTIIMDSYRMCIGNEETEPIYANSLRQQGRPFSPVEQLKAAQPLSRSRHSLVARERQQKPRTLTSRQTPLGWKEAPAAQPDWSQTA